MPLIGLLLAIGGVLALALIVFGIMYCIRTVRKMRRIARAEAAPVAAAKEGEVL